MGYFVAMGVVEEKSSRVVELLLSTLRPRHLLAGKILGLGLLGLGQLLLLAVVGLGLAAAGGALDVDGDVLVAAALALVWFVVGYAFYAAAFALRGVARLAPGGPAVGDHAAHASCCMVGFFVSFGVLDDPDGTLAQVTSFIPPVAPMTMPPRIALGEASAVEIVGALAVTIGGDGAADPARGADLPRRRAADGRRDQAARRLARRAHLTRSTPRGKAVAGRALRGRAARSTPPATAVLGRCVDAPGRSTSPARSASAADRVRQVIAACRAPVAASTRPRPACPAAAVVAGPGDHELVDPHEVRADAVGHLLEDPRAPSMPDVADVSWDLMRRTSSIAASARSTSPRSAPASSPSPSDDDISVRARASEYATSSASRDPSSGSKTTNSLSPLTSRSCALWPGRRSSDATTQTP